MGKKCTLWTCCRGNGLGNCLATGNGTTTCLLRYPLKVSVCVFVWAWTFVGGHLSAAHKQPRTTTAPLLFPVLQSHSWVELSCSKSNVSESFWDKISNDDVAIWKPHTGIKMSETDVLMTAISVRLRVAVKLWVVCVPHVWVWGKSIIVCLCLSPIDPLGHGVSFKSQDRKMGVISGPWGGRRVTILCFHVLCFQAVFSLSRPLVTHLRSPHRSVTNSHSWVTSHDTHADTPSISQSDLSLLMFDEVYACKKKKPWMLAWFWVWRWIPTSVHTTIMCITWKQAYICAPFYEYTSNKQLGHCSPAGHIFSPANEKGARLSPVFYCKETSMRSKSDMRLDHTRRE